MSVREGQAVFIEDLFAMPDQHARNGVAAMRERYVAVRGLGGRERRAVAARLTTRGQRGVICDYENHVCVA
jgi:hypothetical protein